MFRMGCRIVLAAAALAIASSNARADTRFFFHVGAPAPIVAPVPVAPVAVAPIAPIPYGYVWRPAYYVWTGYGYRLMPAAYVRRPYPRAVWVPGGWAVGPRGRYWRQPYWRR